MIGLLERYIHEDMVAIRGSDFKLADLKNFEKYGLVALIFKETAKGKLPRYANYFRITDRGKLIVRALGEQNITVRTIVKKTQNEINDIYASMNTMKTNFKEIEKKLDFVVEQLKSLSTPANVVPAPPVIEKMAEPIEDEIFVKSKSIANLRMEMLKELSRLKEIVNEENKQN